MFDLDKWQEIFNSIQRHKLRTALTALGVFWGIFMLVILLGAGEGLQNGVKYMFRDDATNSLWIRRGVTSMPYKGLPKGRRVQFTNEDFDFLKEQVEEIEHITGRYYIPGGDQVITYKQKSLAYPVRAVHPGHQFLENTQVVNGRYINDTDLSTYRKVAVISQDTKRDVFGNDEAIGKDINIGGTSYTVVGVYFDTGGEYEMRVVYVSITTAQKIYSGTKEIHQVMFTTGDLSLEGMKEVEGEVKRLLSGRLQYDIRDERALWINNRAEDFQEFQNLFAMINGFVWFVGIGSILAGVIGVSNIMLIIVKDRTKEIGIRKAMGATPYSIVSMILTEALFITSLAGYLGLIVGVGFISLMSNINVEYFKNPEVNMGVAFSAVVVLVVAGLLAGLMPALQAARINPVVAMRAK